VGVCIGGKLVDRPREFQFLREETVEADMVCLSGQFQCYEDVKYGECTPQ